MLDIPQIPIEHGDRETHEICPGAKRNSWAFWRPKSMRRWSNRPGTWAVSNAERRNERGIMWFQWDWVGFQWDFNWISIKFCWISWDSMGKTVGKKDWQSGETPWVFSNWDTPWSAVGGGRWEVGSNSPRREHLYMMCFVKLYLIYEFWIHNTWFKSKNNINEQLHFFKI